MIKNVSVSLLLLAGFVAAQNPVVRQSPVTLMTTVAATGTATSSAIRLPNDSNFGTLTVVGSGITGSPSGCQVTLANQQVTAGATSSVFATQAFTPGSSYQAFQITPSSAAFDTGDMVVAVFSCSVYPGAGTISIGFSPTAPPSGVIGTVAISAASLPLPANAAQEAGGNLATIKNSVGNIPALGQALAGSSVPVVLTAAQISTMTPPAAITGFALDASVNGLQVSQGSTTSGEKGSLAMGAVTTNAPGYTTAQTSALSMDTSGLLRMSLKDTPANTNAFLVNTAQIGGTAVVADPCAQSVKLYLSINQTAGTKLVAGTSSKKIYPCSIHVVVAAATNVALVEGTGTVCATSTAGVPGFGGATAATGWNFAANGGISYGNGTSALGQEGTAADDLCLLNSGSGQISGGLSYVVF